MNAPPRAYKQRALEADLQTELKLPHAASVEVVLDIGDLAGISATVDTSVALRA
jgi:hypothetical protein